MDDGTGNGETAELLKRFIEDVAGVEVGSDKDVSFPFDWAIGGFLVGNDGAYGGVELHFAINEPIGVVLPNLIDNVIDFVEVGILTAGAVGGVGKHGDSGSVSGVSVICDGGVFDDGVKLVPIWDFVDAAVGEGEDLTALLADETTGEIFGP